MNVNVPHFQSWLRREFLYDGKKGRGEFVECLVFGAASLSGRAIGFHVLLRNGAQIGRVPVHALCQRPVHWRIPLEHLQVWDCFSYDMEVVEYAWLESARCEVFLRDKKWYRGEYMFTFDWYGNTAAESAGDTGWKCGHMIELDCGLYAIQPNNRIRWYDASWVTEEFPERPDYLTQSQTFKCEDGSKWANEDRYFYGVQSERDLGDG